MWFQLHQPISHMLLLFRHPKVLWLKMLKVLRDVLPVQIFASGPISGSVSEKTWQRFLTRDPTETWAAAIWWLLSNKKGILLGTNISPSQRHFWRWWFSELPVWQDSDRSLEGILTGNLSLPPFRKCWWIIPFSQILISWRTPLISIKYTLRKTNISHLRNR